MVRLRARLCVEHDREDGKGASELRVDLCSEDALAQLRSFVGASEAESVWFGDTVRGFCVSRVEDLRALDLDVVHSVRRAHGLGFGSPLQLLKVWRCGPAFLLTLSPPAQWRFLLELRRRALLPRFVNTKVHDGASWSWPIVLAAQRSEVPLETLKLLASCGAAASAAPRVTLAAEDSDGKSALFRAVQVGDAAKIQYLNVLTSGHLRKAHFEDVLPETFCDDAAMCPLSALNILSAASFYDVEIARWTVALGRVESYVGDVNAMSKRGDSLCSEALVDERGRRECALYALAQHPHFNVDTRWSTKTALTFIAFSNAPQLDVAVLRWFVEVAGADVKCADSEDRRAVERARDRGHAAKEAYLVEVERALDSGLESESESEPESEPESAARTPDFDALVRAFCAGDLIAARRWMSRHDITFATLEPSVRAAVCAAVFETLAARAQQQLHLNVTLITTLRLLHARAFDFATPWHAYGFTPLTFAAWSRALPVSVLRFLLETAGVPASAADAAKRTALHCAIDSASTLKVRLLLQTRSAELDARNADGETPLAAAQTLGLTQFAHWLHVDACLRADPPSTSLVSAPPLGPSPLFVLTVGTGAGVADARAFEEFASRSGAAAVFGVASAVPSELEFALLQLSQELRLLRVPTSSSSSPSSSPFVLLHFSGQGFVDADGEVHLGSSITPPSSSPTVLKLSRIVGHLARSMRTGAIVAMIDLTGPIAAPSVKPNGTDGVDGTDGAHVAVAIVVGRRETPQLSLSNAALHTLARSRQGVLLTAQSFVTGTLCMTNAMGLATEYAPWCDDALARVHFCTASYADGDFHGMLREAIETGDVSVLPAIPPYVFKTVDAFGFPALYYAMLLAEGQTRDVMLEALAWRVIVSLHWLGVPPKTWAARDRRMGPHCVRWLEAHGAAGRWYDGHGGSGYI